MTERICSKCGQSKPETSEFFSSRGTSDRGGLRPDCKVCQAQRDREYRTRNAAKVRARRGAYRLANADLISASDAAYRQTERGRDASKRASRKWNTSPDGRLFYAITQLRRRAEKSGLLADFTAEDWRWCLVFFGGRCAYCGSAERLTQEHVVPDSKGGPYTARNVIVACRPCNTSKHDSDMESWFRQQPFFDAARLVRIREYTQT